MNLARLPSARRADLVHVEELLVRLTVLRRQLPYRQLLAEGTDLAGRVATMQLLRAVDALNNLGTEPSVGEVADRLGIEQSNASKTVDYAVRRRLVVKERSAEDARRMELTLSEHGRAVIGELDSRRDQVHDEMFRTWTDDELGSLAELLEKLRDSYEVLVSSAQSPPR